MISELHFKILDTANRELSRRFTKLHKARSSRDPNGIKQAKTEYFQSLQHLYAAVQDAVRALRTGKLRKFLEILSGIFRKFLGVRKICSVISAQYDHLQRILLKASHSFT